MDHLSRLNRRLLRWSTLRFGRYQTSAAGTQHRQSSMPASTPLHSVSVGAERTTPERPAPSALHTAINPAKSCSIYLRCNPKAAVSVTAYTATKKYKRQLISFASIHYTAPSIKRDYSWIYYANDLALGIHPPLHTRRGTKPGGQSDHKLQQKEPCGFLPQGSFYIQTGSPAFGITRESPWHEVRR